jgi:uncharacterized protein YjbI with pentapeptide repeats
MANQQHLPMFQEGVDPWNQWKKSHRCVIAVFSEACLDYIDLSNADLIGSNFTGANLIRTNLRGADLREANLSQADLNWAIPL